ncbi:MAG: hypothetical protein ABEI52_00615 [Halobacteriaceae archaeon]
MFLDTLQRTALLLVAFGGFLELSGAIRNNWGGLYGVGNEIMLLGLLLGIACTLIVGYRGVSVSNS